MYKYTRIVTLLVLVVASFGAFGQVTHSVQAQYDRFYQSISKLNAIDTLRQSARAQQIQEEYDDIFKPILRSADLGSRPEADLHLLFDAASIASFENPEGSTYKDALMVLNRLGLNATDREIKTAEEMLFQARKPNELNALSSKYANRQLSNPPKFEIRKSPGLHRVLVVSGNRLTTAILDIGRGPRVVVVAHPLCHFTQDAVKAIYENTPLKEVMSKIAVWIAPPDRNMDFTAFSAWRSKYPDARIFTAYSYSSWPELEEWGTPTFYFFQDGKLVNTVVGWPRGGHMAELEAALTRLGVEVK